MAKRRVKAHKKKGFTAPVAIIAGFAPGVVACIDHTRYTDQWHPQAGIQGALVEASRIYLGYSPTDGNFQPSLMTRGLLPAIVGFAVHKFVGGSLGVNRMLASAGIPIIRL